MQLTSIYGKRNPTVHKGQFGRLLIIAGSKKYTGSPIFNAMAALRAGCDLVTVAAPERSAFVAASYAPDIITYPLKGDYLSIEYIDEILSLIESDHITAVVMGGGLGRNDEVFNAIESLITPMNLPMVLDAEALRCIGQRKLQFDGRGKTILTPNRNEILDLLPVILGSDSAGWRRTTPESAFTQNTDPGLSSARWRNSARMTVKTNEKVLPNEEKIKELITKVSIRSNSIILLKGHTDLISDGREVVENSSGSPFMTKGGFGDTLAGICGALLARGIDAFPAAQAAAYINGKAGELAAKEKGEGLVASDIFYHIPQVLISA